MGNNIFALFSNLNRLFVRMTAESFTRRSNRSKNMNRTLSRAVVGVAALAAVAITSYGLLILIQQEGQQRAGSRHQEP